MNEFINKNRKTLFTTITVLLGITLTITFAYFANTIGDAANTNVDVTSQGTKSLVFNVEKTLSLVANIDNFADGDGSISDTAVASATLTKGSTEESSTEDYYVYFKINTNDYVYTTVDKKPEMILTIIDPDGNEVTTGVDGYTHTTVTDAHTNEDITGFDITESTGTIIIKTNYPITTTSTIKHNWTAKVTFVNLDTLQNENQLKTMNAEFSLSDLYPYGPINEYVPETHTISDGLYYHSDGTEIAHISSDSNFVRLNNLETINTMQNSANDGSYRYSGANPNNYVSFNDEIWRIIGVFNESSHGVEGEELVKIVRSSVLGELSIDPDNINDWVQSDLNYILNEHYLNNTDGTNTGRCFYYYPDNIIGDCNYTNTGIKTKYTHMIQDVTWYLGSADTENQTAKNFYDEERGTVVYTGRPISHIAKIGLVYPSDYGFSAENTCWQYNLSDYYTHECVYNTWFNDVNGSTPIWSITPAISGTTHLYWGNLNRGSMVVRYFGVMTSGQKVLPTLYLKSSVEISSGTGTESDPFILTM